jgi:hypothetical protein
MRRSGVRVLQGLAIVAAGAAMSGSAHAQSFSRWRNANTTNGTFYLGVSGGEVCDPANDQCGVAAGTQLITWQKGGDDQQWKEVLPGGGFVDFQDFFPDPWTNTGTCMHVRGQSNSENANLETQSGGACLTEPSARWRPIRAEDMGAPFPTCIAFQNLSSGMYVSVSQGNVKNGSHVIQWPLCQSGSSACGSPAGFHADQWWCPEAP